MAKKIDLTISTEYVPSWTIVDGVRELFQNALDQQSQDSSKAAYWEYLDKEESLVISNENSTLELQSLLLGTSTKKTDHRTIGQFGEGYKIATLVLLREGKQITFYNNGNDEIWKPRLVKSRRFKTTILSFDIVKNVTSAANLTIRIDGITAEEFYHQIVPSNLHLREDYNILETTSLGDVIDIKGQVFVNGLFVCGYGSYKYGYNFNAGEVSLDRDRKLVSDFDLKWLSSKLWAKTNSDKVIELLKAGAADVAYVHNNVPNKNMIDKAYHTFINEHGANAVPVSYHYQLEDVPEGRKGIIVSESYRDMIRKSNYYEEPVVEEENVLDLLRDWYASVTEAHELSSELCEAFDEIVEKLESMI